MGKGKTFHKDGLYMDKALDPVVLVLYREQQIYLNLWGVDNFGISA